MAGRIIGCFCCLLCAFPFFMMDYLGKMRRDPLSFWSGDDSLKDKVRDVQSYNREMGILYRRYGLCYAAAAVCFLVIPVLGVGILLTSCTVGIYLVYRRYKSILEKYS